MARMTAQARKQVEAFKAVTVKHPRLTEVDERVSRAVDEKADAAHVLVYGPSGVGKSLLMERVTSRFRTEESRQDIVPMIKIEARPPDTGAYVRLDYYRQVLTALKEHVVVRELLVNINLSAKPSRTNRNGTDWLEIRDAVEQALRRLQVKAVVIDEAEHLMLTDADHKPVDQLDWLKSITNHTNVLHILVGPYALCDFRNLEGQSARRGRDVHFPRYHLDDPTERMEYIGALRYLLERIPLTCDMPTFLERWRWFGELSLGCIGILKGWLLETVAATLAEGQTALTVEALQANVLESGQRVRIELDARAGEHKLAVALAESQKRERELWGKPPEAPSPSASPGSADPPKRRGPRPGTRKPKRDPTGDDSEDK